MALGVSLLLPAAPAAAHNSLTGSDPRDGARLASAPARIELRFLATLDPATTKVTVTGPDNVPAAGGTASVSGSRVTVPLRPGRAGLYIVGYQVTSGDGHPVTGEIRFTLTTGTAADPSATAPAPGTFPPSAGPAATTPVPGPATTPATAPAVPSSGTASPMVDAVPAAGEDDGGQGLLWVLSALAVLAALATAVLLKRRRPHP